MKTLQWLRNSKGEFEQVGFINPKKKKVRIEFLSEDGKWQEVGNHVYNAKNAFELITYAIEKKQTGKWYGYRLAPVESMEDEPNTKKKSGGRKDGQAR